MKNSFTTKHTIGPNHPSILDLLKATIQWVSHLHGPGWTGRGSDGLLDVLRADAERLDSQLSEGHGAALAELGQRQREANRFRDVVSNANTAETVVKRVVDGIAKLHGGHPTREQHHDVNGRRNDEG